jgi:filamentous hemagglutinin
MMGDVIPGASLLSRVRLRAPSRGLGQHGVNLLDPVPAPAGRSFIYSDPSKYAHGRSMALQELVPPASRGRITMSAAVVEDAQGVRRVLIGTSEPGGYLRPGVKGALKPDEILVPGLKHAEQDLVAYANRQGYKVISVGAGRPHCPTCVMEIEAAGGVTASPRR